MLIKSLFSIRSSLLFVLLSLVSGMALACYDRGDTVRKYLQLGNLKPDHRYQIDYVNNPSATLDICFCPSFGFNGCFGDIEFANIDPNNLPAYPQILGKGCPSYPDTSTGQSFFHSRFAISNSQQVILDIVVPDDAPYSSQARFKVDLYDITGGSPVFVRTSSEAWFGTCAEPAPSGSAPARPTDIHNFPSQSRSAGCGWKFSTNVVSGATQYIWRINNQSPQSYSSHTPGPTLPITSSGVYNVCLSASNSHGTSPQYCENVSLSSLSCF